MKRTVVSLLAAALFAAPAAASAGSLTLRNLDVSIGVHAAPPVVYVDRQPQTVYVRDDDDRWERRHDRRHYREERRERRRRDREPRVIVIDRDGRSRRCDEDRIVVTRPGTVVVMNDGRRW